MLSDAIGAFLDSVSERAFDQALLALLRARGYSRVHLVHGHREFGKDVIGQRAGEQWAWQSKAGNIGQAEWRALVGQLDELRLTNLGHGGFDLSLRRRPVLVTTGRLTGNAPDLFRDYNERAAARNEPGVELWDRDILTGFLVDNPDAVLRGSLDGHFLTTLGSAAEGAATMQSIEIFSRRWTSWEPERIAGLGVVEAALVSDRLADEGRLDLACHLALCLLRGALAAGSVTAAREAAAALFEEYALRLWTISKDLADGDDFHRESQASAWVTYPIRCTRIGELLGLLVLLQRERESDVQDEVSSWLVGFAEGQPGAAHPISDAYGVSLIPLVLSLAGVNLDAARTLLTKAAIWLCDAYESPRLGIASVDADVDEQVERLLGGPLEWVDRERRRDSSIGTILLDLAVILGLEDVYADIYNDLKAVRIYPRMLRLEDGPGALDREGMGNHLDPNVDFAETFAAGHPLAPHHEDAAGTQLCREGRSWDLLAVSSAIRDRHFFCSLQAFAPPAG